MDRQEPIIWDYFQIMLDRLDIEYIQEHIQLL